MIDFDDFDGMTDEQADHEFEDDNVGDLNEPENSDCDLDEHFNTDELDVSEDEISSLERKASNIERSEDDKRNISFGRKCCPTRHGCQGATDCDYAYGSYPF